MRRGERTAGEGAAGRRARLAGAGAAALLLAVAAGEAAAAYRVDLGGDGGPLFSAVARPTIAGTTDAPAGSAVAVAIGESTATATVGADGAWGLTWPEDLLGGAYELTVTVTGPAGTGSARATLVVQPPGRLPRRPLIAPASPPAPPEAPPADEFRAFTDRWRVVPPPYELTTPGSRWDPYHQNRWKGDFPIRGDDVFLVLTGVSDTLVEARTLPTASGVSTDRPGSVRFFGDDGQLFVNQTVVVSADLFKGATAFKPFDWRVKATLVGNLNHVRVAENAVVKPDVRRGTARTDGRAALQELFVEKKLADLSPNYDFVSLRVGIQPFASDFRGFVFTDTNLALRLFGNLKSNRWQYNLLLSERLEKDTNSGLNTFELRDQQVAVVNVYRQDTPVEGLTQELSVHYLRDEASFHFDRNGFLVRPDPVGSFTPHQVEALYLGWASFGHLGRINFDHAFYFVTGTDSLNPIAGEDLASGRAGVDVRALFAAAELSMDRNWVRPRLALLYASGDDDPTDRDATGFDAIFDNPAFAGGGFSFWNRMGIRLAGTGVTLVNRGSLLPDLKSSKEEGQPNFVNPGLRLASAGVDLELTPKWKASATVNYLAFDATEPLELILFQAPIDREIGWDLSFGARWRPFLNNNAVVLGGVAALVPGQGFEAIYEESSALLAGFVNLSLSF